MSQRPRSSPPASRSRQTDAAPAKSVGAAEKSLSVLQLLSREGRAMTLAEMAEILSIPKATAHRLCARLLELQFITRYVDERFFAIGPALRALAFDALSHGTLNGLRRQLLGELVAETGETCNFTTLDGVEVLYLDRVEAQRPWRLTLSIGAHVPLHCTASGKLFLSYMPTEQRRALLDRLPMKPLTDNSITDTARLWEELELTRQRNYGFDDEEFVVGLIAVAVPVHDKSGTLRAAVAMHCPTSHVTVEQSIVWLPSLQKAAARMGQLL